MSIQDAVIEVVKVSKTYKIYLKPYHRLLELLNFGSKYQEVKALKEISFKVPKGKTMGIVGPNGSGKSTLLQMITGILQPSSGSIKVNGRVSALLELGAGFNPEYTGRENIYLYASILGVSKPEIDDKIKHIIDFAQIGDFIDRSVKTYSSGMYVRLAFSVAINVEPDILIVDEALAVGDETFQRKCFRKFEDLKAKGVTILFVTHSLGLVKQFCDEAILLYHGEFIEQGHPNHIINLYTKLIADKENYGDIPKSIEVIKEVNNITGTDTQELSEFRYGNADGKILSFKMYGEHGNISKVFKHGEKIIIEVKVEYLKMTEDSLVAYTIKSITGVEITGTNTAFENVSLEKRSKGDVITVIFTQNTSLNAGDYVLSLGFVDMINDNVIVMDRRYDAVTFKVTETKKSTGFVDPKADIQVQFTSREAE